MPGAHTMQCMEVWGGNQAVEQAVQMPGLDAWVYSRPYKGDVGGGDVHYLSSCATGRITRLLVADVSGHGQGVSEVAVRLRDLMRRFVNYLDQTQFVSALNREFAGTAADGSFATALVATYWAPTRYFVTSNAGHPRPFHYRAATGTWETLERASKADALEPTNLPLGILEPTRYEQFGVRIEPGDMVFVYTDSLVEARAPDGSMLGEAGLRAMLDSLTRVAPADLIGALLEKLQAFTAGAPLGDDVTALLLRESEHLTERRGIGAALHAFWLFSGLLLGKLAGSKAPIPWPEARLENIGGAIVPRLSLRWGRAKRGTPGPTTG